MSLADPWIGRGLPTHDRIAKETAHRGHASDDELMRLTQADDAGAFAQLYDRYAARALRVATSVCRTTAAAEDAVQEGFLSIWRTRASFRAGQSSFGVWSMMLVRHRAIDALRRDSAASRPQVVDLDVSTLEATSSSVPDEVIARAEHDSLHAALARLPDAQAEVITLAFFGELTHQEIAMHLSLPEGTVKGRMRLGLQKLRDDSGAGG